MYIFIHLSTISLMKNMTGPNRIYSIFCAKILNLFCGFLFLQRGILSLGGGNAAGGRSGRINGRGRLTRQPGCLDNWGLDDKGLRGKDSSGSSFIYRSNHLPRHPPNHPFIPKIILGIHLLQIIYEMLLNLSFSGLKG